MIINRHSDSLDTSGGTGNGYHGRCKYCKAPLITDLGFFSFPEKCIDRESVNEWDIPEYIQSYARFNNLIWSYKLVKYIIPYSKKEYTIDEIDIKIKTIFKNE